MNKLRFLPAALLTTLVLGCAAVQIDLPAITDEPTGAHLHGKVVWHDLLTSTPAESRQFYEELFGWEFVHPGISIGLKNEDPYMLIRHNGQLIGGMVDANALEKKEENVSQWITVFSVADVDAAAANVTKAGGSVLTPPTELQSRGTLAVVEDAQGAVLALIETKGGDPIDQEPAINQFLWNEIWTSDVAGARDFYQSVVGFEAEDRDIGSEHPPYHLLTMAGAPRAGVLDNPFKGAPPVWVNYLRVEDPAAIVARVESLGGRILVPAHARDIGGSAAFIAGPSGAGIALQTWPLTPDEAKSNE